MNRAQQNQMQLRLQQQLSDDMKYLRAHYGWTDEDVGEIRRAAHENPGWWDYWPLLAKAWRAAEAGRYEPMFGDCHDQ